MLNTLVNTVILAREETPSLDKLLNEADKHLKDIDDLIEPAPESKPRTPFDSGLSVDEQSLPNLSLLQKFQAAVQGIPLMINMQRASQMYTDGFQPTAHEASPEFVERLEALADELGVADIAYVKVPRNAIFAEKGIPHECAVVFTVEMAPEPWEDAPSWEAQHEVMKGYKNLAVIANKLADFMREHGFAAAPGTALGGVTDYPHLAELAGLGAIGYHGLLISPHEGARLRISTIYTNITTLPLAEENEHLWVRDFCAMCKKCVRACPVEAIYQQPEPRGDGGMQCIDHDTCRDYFAKNYGCGICLAVCPFSQVGYEKVKQRFKGNPNAPQFVIPVYSTRSRT